MCRKASASGLGWPLSPSRAVLRQASGAWWAGAYPCPPGARLQRVAKIGGAVDRYDRRSDALPQDPLWGWLGARSTGRVPSKHETRPQGATTGARRSRCPGSDSPTALRIRSVDLRAPAAVLALKEDLC